MSGRKASDNARSEDWAWLDALVGKLDEDFIQAATEKPPNQERPELEIFNRADFKFPSSP